MERTQMFTKTWHIAGPAMTLAVALGYLLYSATQSHAHDWKRPNLDNWYSGLQRPLSSPYGGSGSQSCCSKEDCHTTDAEMRKDADGTYHWWARYIRLENNPKDWDAPKIEVPDEWVRVPDELIVKGPNGNAVRNEAGEAVLCHTQSWADHRAAPQAASYYCFVPPNQS